MKKRENWKTEDSGTPQPEKAGGKPPGKSKKPGIKGEMVKRGVSRPMAEKEIKKKSHKQHHSSKKRSGSMNYQDRKKMLHMHHMQTLWVYWMIILLGVWMLLSPLTFSYGKSVVDPSGGRSVWLSLSARITIMTWSDIVSGMLLIFYGWRSLTPNRPVSLWVVCFVGIWLNVAPLVFWAPNAAAYINDTLVGTLLIALSILIPGMPNMMMYMKMGNQVPPGWSYNPSSWPQRWIMIGTGFLGWMVSRYLGAFQLGYIDQIWDPFFGNGSRQVLNSNMSHMWPISDGAMGALAYTLEFLMGWMGSPSRWRTMPWMVTFFGILVIPLGLVHIFLVISQPVVVGHWCTFCLLAAAIMLPMIPLEIDEVFAMFQFLKYSKKKGRNMWKVFWKGGEIEDGGKDDRSPQLMKFPQQPGKVFRAAIWGMSFPRTLILSSIIGIWLMFSPWVFGLTDWAANFNHLGGALIVVTSVIAMGEIIRTLRVLNILLALVVIIGTWTAQGAGIPGQINAIVTGILVIISAVPIGTIKQQYGMWDSYIR
ncbi:MAG: vitamin K epoxide reductase family protein [Candidatus Cyclobacteriaceae bacterium M3_2C_046]